MALLIQAQQRPQTPSPTPTPGSGTPAGTSQTPSLNMPNLQNFMGNQRQGPRAYKDVITEKAVTKKGLFTVHKVEDKY
ncbi:DUF5118 domain-containing protein, partial [Acinetobacter baumannii]